jgi:hypothetical protein
MTRSSGTFAPVALRMVANQSTTCMISVLVWPGFTWSGQRTMQGVRRLPSPPAK